MRLTVFVATAAAFLVGSQDTCLGKPRSQKTPAHGAERENRQELTYIPADCRAAWVVRPDRLVQSPGLAAYWIEGLLDEVPEKLGLRLHKIERLILLPRPRCIAWSLPGWSADAAIARFAEPVDGRRLLEGHWPGLREKTDRGKTYFKQRGRNAIAAYFPDERTMIVAGEERLREILAAGKAESPLIERLRTIDPDHDVIGVLFNEPARQTAEEDDGEDLFGWDEAAEKFDAFMERVGVATATANLRGDRRLTLVLEGIDAASTVWLEQECKTFIANRRGELRSSDEICVFGQFAGQIIEDLRVRRRRGQVVIELPHAERLITLLHMFGLEIRRALEVSEKEAMLEAIEALDRSYPTMDPARSSATSSKRAPPRPRSAPPSPRGC